MPAYVPIEKPTKDQALDAGSKLPLCGKDKTCRTSTVRKYVQKHGPLEFFDSKGKLISYASYQQTITDVPSKPLAMDGLRDIYSETDPRAFSAISAAIEKLASNSWPGYYKRLNAETAGELQAHVDVADKNQDGGMIKIYGASTFGIRKTRPVPGKHHTVLPGELPLSNEEKVDAE